MSAYSRRPLVDRALDQTADFILGGVVMLSVGYGWDHHKGILAFGIMVYLLMMVRVIRDTR